MTNNNTSTTISTQHPLKEVPGLRNISPGTNPGTNTEIVPNRAIQDLLETTPVRDNHPEKVTKGTQEREEVIGGTLIRKLNIGALKRGITLKSLRRGGERGPTVADQGMCRNLDTEKYLGIDKEIEDREKGA